jgi:hypothetical protein
MIENIRKYTGLMIVIFVVLIISFIFMDTSALQRVGGGGEVVTVEGRSYNERDFRRLGGGAFELTSGLAQSGDFGLYQFIMTLTGGAMSQDEAARNFFVGRMILREARDEFGVHPGDEEISTFLRNMRAFAGPDGGFSEERYRTFLERGIGRMGMTESDLRELAADVLVSQKLTGIIGAGLGADRDTVAHNLALENQQITAQLGRLELAPFEEQIEPSEEQIREFWEVLQDAFTTEPRRSFTYFIVSPTFPEEPAEPVAPELPADASDEDKAAAEQAAEEARSKAAADAAQARREAQKEVDAAVDAFLFEMEQQAGAGFEELARENGWEVQSTGLFARGEAPAELDVELRASTRGGKAVDELFGITAGADLFSRISEAIAIGDGQWLVARLDEVQEARPKTYEEARDEARAQFISEKATEAMREAADQAVTTIREAIAGSSSFADAAAAAGLQDIRTAESFNRFYRPDGDGEPPNLFEVTRAVDPGSFAEVVVESDRAFVIFVERREIIEGEISDARIDSELTSRTNENETIAFLSWMKARTEAANVAWRR